MTKKRLREYAEVSNHPSTRKKLHHEHSMLMMKLHEIFSFRLCNWGFDPSQNPIGVLFFALRKLELLVLSVPVQWDAYSQREREMIFITMTSYLLDPQIQRPSADGSLLDIQTPNFRQNPTPQEFLCDLIIEVLLWKTPDIENCRGYFLWKSTLTSHQKSILEHVSLNYENFQSVLKFSGQGIIHLYRMAEECGFEVMVPQTQSRKNHLPQERSIVEFKWPADLEYNNSSEIVFNDPKNLLDHVLRLAKLVWDVRLVNWGSSPTDAMQELNESLFIVRKLFQRVSWEKLNDQDQYVCAIIIVQHLLDANITIDTFHRNDNNYIHKRITPNIHTPQSLLLDLVFRKAKHRNVSLANICKYISSEMDDESIISNENYSFRQLTHSLDHVLNIILRFAQGICNIRESISRCGFIATFPVSLTPSNKYIIVFSDAHVENASHQQEKIFDSNGSSLNQTIQSSTSSNYDINNKINNDNSNINSIKNHSSKINITKLPTTEKPEAQSWPKENPNKNHTCYMCGRRNHLEENCRLKTHPYANKNPALHWKDTSAATWYKDMHGVKNALPNYLLGGIPWESASFDTSLSNIEKSTEEIGIQVNLNTHTASHDNSKTSHISNRNSVAIIHGSSSADDQPIATAGEDMISATVYNQSIDANEYQRLMRRVRELQVHLRQEKAKAQSLFIEKDMIKAKCDALEAIVQTAKQDQDNVESELWGMIDSAMKTVTSLQKYQENLLHVLNEANSTDAKGTPEIAQRRRLKDQKYQEQIFWLTKENTGLLTAFHNLQEQVDQLFNLLKHTNIDNNPENNQAMATLEYYVREDGTIDYGVHADAHSEMSEKLSNHALKQVKAIQNEVSAAVDAYVEKSADISSNNKTHNDNDFTNSSATINNISNNGKCSIYNNSSTLNNQINNNYHEHAFSDNNNILGNHSAHHKNTDASLNINDHNEVFRNINSNSMGLSVPSSTSGSSDANRKVTNEKPASLVQLKTGEVSLLEQLLQRPSIPSASRAGKSAMKSVYSIPLSAMMNPNAILKANTTTSRMTNTTTAGIDTATKEETVTTSTPGIRNNSRLKQLLAEKVAQEKAKKSLSNDV